MPFSEIDEDERPDLPLISFCAKRSCRLTARRPGDLCHACNAKMTKTWREKRRKAGLSTAGAGKAAPSASADAVRQRVALHRAIASGKIERQRCGFDKCEERERVLALRLDPERPDQLTWRCRLHRSAELGERTRDAQAIADRTARYEAYHAQPARLKTALELLEDAPPDVAAAIRAEAASFRSMRLAESSPLYRQRLAQLAETHLRSAGE